MIDLANLLGLALNFIGALLLVIFRSPGLDVTADGRGIVQWENEPTAESRAKNLRRYWINASATRIGLIFLCVGFLLQLGAFVASTEIPDNENTRTKTFIEHWRSSI